MTLNDKFVGFLSVTPNEKFWRLFQRAGVKNLLISYHYIRQDKGLADKMIKWVQDEGGLFMTDCGAFSMFNDKNFNGDTFQWEAYLQEYLDWLGQNSKRIFCAANLDVEKFVGAGAVDLWNKEFEKLEKYTNVIYLAHQNVMGGGAMDRLKYYAEKKKYKYIGVDESFAKHVAQVYSYSKQYKFSVHGFAWTKPTILREFPFFSVDSSSWVNYQKYGATPVWDGTNFTQYDKDKKHIRTTLKRQCEKYGVKHYEFVNEKFEDGPKKGMHNDDEGLTFSIRTWLDVFANVNRMAKSKLDVTVQKMLHHTDARKVTMATKKEQLQKKMEESGNWEILDPNTSAESLKDLLMERPEVEGESNHGIEYRTDEESGQEIATYKARERSEKVTLSQFEEEYGNTGLFCDNCMVNSRCPKYQPGYACAFDFAPDGAGDIFVMLDAMIKTQQERVNRAMFIEKMEGGQPNKIFTSEFGALQNMLKLKADLIMASKTKSVQLSISYSETDLAGLPDGQKQGGGVMAMFAQLMGTEPKKIEE